MPESQPADNDSFWALNPPDAALAIVQQVFGKYFRRSKTHKMPRSGQPIILVMVDECDTEPYDQAVEEQLDAIGWQMVIFRANNKTQFRAFPHPPFAPLLPEFTLPPTTLTFYALAPFSLVDPRPTKAFHVTRKTNIESILRQGLLPGTGANGYPNTKDKIFVCPTCSGPFESAERWVELLCKADNLLLSDYAILEVNLALVPQARMYNDLHSCSGIVIDRLANIPSTAINVRYLSQ